MGVGKFNFCQNFCMDYVSFVDLLWMLASCWHFKHVLRVDFTMFMHFIIYRVLMCTLSV